MNIVKGRPPNYDAIVLKFPSAKRPGTIFAYGETIYVTGNNDLSDSLRTHEAVHVRQQKAVSPALWWQQYLDDSQFRFQQELEAHRAEYYYFLNFGRNVARVNLKLIAKRFASPLYGSFATESEAKKLIKSIAC